VSLVIVNSHLSRDLPSFLLSPSLTTPLRSEKAEGEEKGGKGRGSKESERNHDSEGRGKERGDLFQIRCLILTFLLHAHASSISFPLLPHLPRFSPYRN
jgi:hypothetical protein